MFEIVLTRGFSDTLGNALSNVFFLGILGVLFYFLLIAVIADRIHKNTQAIRDVAEELHALRRSIEAQNRRNDDNNIS